MNISHNEARPGQEKELVVFWLVGRNSSCSQCNKEVGPGNFLRVENGQGLCLECADLDHLVFLESGDHALTRRAKKHSKLWAVVVKFSRARKRYERQGLLVEEEAVERAEQECEADSEIRAERRTQAAGGRAEEDVMLAKAMEAKLMEMFPGCPRKSAQEIALHTSRRGSGRVGRSAAGRSLDEEALRMATIAHIRHRHTEYDRLLMQGAERAYARACVRDKVQEILEGWSDDQFVIDNL